MLRNFTFEQKLLLILTIFAILSITLIEIAIFVFCMYTFYRILKNKKIDFSSLGVHIIIQSIPLLVVHFLFLKKYIIKAIDRTLGSFVYFYRFSFDSKDSKNVYDYFYFYYNVLIIIGLLLIPIVIYNNYRTGFPKALWGGFFEVSFFYSLFLLAGLALFIYTKSRIYILLVFLFLGMIIFSTRRSTILGLLLTSLLILYQSRDVFKITYKRMILIILVLVSLSFLTISGVLFYLTGKYFPRDKTAFEVLIGKRELDLTSLDDIASSRLRNAIAGIEVIKRDIREGNLRAILFGHGLYAGERLEPRSPDRPHYESVILITMFIERGLIGLIATILIYYKFYRFSLSLRYRQREHFLFMPLISMLSIHLVASTITLYWDALLPLYLLYFRYVENAYQAGFFHKETHIS